MERHSAHSIAQLVQPARVHRSLYVDPEIFELEMRHIFGAAWIYVGHESQVKNAGDYFCTRIGRKPIIVVRDAEGQLQVIHNQCAHRGAMVVASDKGHTDEFQCCYHGWTYHLDGRLKAIPLQHGYPPDFNPKSSKTAMLQVARVTSYRGFIFVNEAADGPSLEESLNHMTTSIDDMVDRAPDGEIQVAGGVFRHTYNGNWKLYLENLCDAAHPWFTHRSSIDAAQQQKDDVVSDGSGEIAIRQMRQNGAPYSFWESQVGIWTYPNGHSYLGDYHDDSKLVAAMNDPVFRDYIAALEARKGKEVARKILEVRRWNSIVYPNLSFMSQFQQLRVIHPDRGQPHRSAHLLLQAVRRAGADVPEHGQLRQCRQRHGLAGADRRSRNLQSHRYRTDERRRRVDRDRPRLSKRWTGRARRPQGQELDQ